MRFQRVTLSVALVLAILAGNGCHKSDNVRDPSGPDLPFPATYSGQYCWDVLPICGELVFTINGLGTVNGTWTGKDENGDWWHLTITGEVNEGALSLEVTGYYDQSSCAITGRADGVSNDDYESFSGTWLLTECHGFTLQGTWTVQRIS
ncbi:hypothetical protein JW905_11335 [bacterium]|nr:hypothetical protein [candidate division CSSED10-310 bacterium]